MSTAPRPRYAWPNAFRCKRSAAVLLATCTKPRVRLRRRTGACCTAAAPRRRRVSIRVDIKTCASSLLFGRLLDRLVGRCVWCLVAGGVRAGYQDLGGGKTQLELFRHPEPR